MYTCYGISWNVVIVYIATMHIPYLMIRDRVRTDGWLTNLYMKFQSL